MQLINVVLVALSALVAAPQALAQSACVLQCSSEAATQFGCVSPTNATCVCSSEEFQNAARACITDTCPDDLAQAEQLQQALCGGASGSPSGSAAPSGSGPSGSATGAPSGSPSGSAAPSGSGSTAAPSGSRSPSGSSPASGSPSPSTSTRPAAAVAIGIPVFETSAAIVLSLIVGVLAL